MLAPVPSEYMIAGGLTDAQRLARQAHVMAEATEAFLRNMRPAILELGVR
jgi:F0F1-type ATP synthase membrane subunit b/b'